MVCVGLVPKQTVNVETFTIVDIRTTRNTGRFRRLTHGSCFAESTWLEVDPGLQSGKGRTSRIIRQHGKG